MKKLLSILLTLALLTSVLTSCGSTSTSTSSQSSSESASTGGQSSEDATESKEVTHVLVGTAGKPAPFVTTDENNRVTGFEAEVLYAVDELLEDYEFEFELISDFSVLFTSIDAGKYDMGVNNISKTEEREEKYLFSDEYVGYSLAGIVVRKDDDSIQTLEDLAGKTTRVEGNGSYNQLFLEAFNETHPDNPVELVYSSAEKIKVLQDLEGGVYDFIFENAATVDTFFASYPDLAESLKFVTFSDEETKQIEENPYTWYLYPKTEEGEALKEAVDGALRQLKEDGTVNEIAQEFLHYDVVR